MIRPTVNKLRSFFSALSKLLVFSAVTFTFLFSAAAQAVPPQPPGPLSEALDTSLSFTTGGNANWFRQTATSFYEGDAAQSGDISHSQDSWMQTTVSGTGTLRFRWKVSSEPDYDFLEFYLDNSRLDRISGSVNWREKICPISTSGSHTLKWRYVKDGGTDVGSDCGWVDKLEWVTTPEPPSPWALPEVLDTALTITTGGSAAWFGQSATFYYGEDAAQSGNISHSQDSWMQTTVSGIGRVKFYWKVSSENNYDFLEFYIDGSRRDRISGSVDWQQKTYTLNTSGSHTLEWRYVKDGGTNFGSDCGWVDKLEWVPTPQPTPPSVLSEALDTVLNFTTGGNANWFHQTDPSYYGQDAAQSGDISHSQDSWMQTSVNGKGIVKFYWKVSSEDNYDFLEFYIDGSRRDRISGSVDWQQKTYTIDTWGPHELEWQYVKDGSADAGSDCGWVDKVEWLTAQIGPDNVFSIGISEIWDYNNPTNPNDLTYVFRCLIETYGKVNLIKMLTPAGNTFTIPNDPYTKSGNVETWHFVEEGKHYWEYEASFDDLNGLLDYGDGTYTINVHYTDGSQAETTVLFANPNTGKPILQPTQEPILTSPAHNETTSSPVTFAWQDCSDPNATSIWLAIAKVGTEDEINFDFPVNAKKSDPLNLSSGLWEAALCFDHWYDFNNVNGIPVEVGKYSESDYTFEVIDITLVSSWSMDDNAANTTVVDSSGNGNNGTAQRYTKHIATQGVIDGALAFNGRSDYINCGKRRSLNITGSITLSAWIYPASLNGTIISKRTYSRGPVVQYLLDTDDHNKLRFLWYNRGWKGVSHDASALTNQWSHVVGTYDADSNVVKLYVNGNEVASGKERSGLISNNVPVMIGAWHNGVTACNVFKGAIDQVMIFNRALSPAEVSALARYDEEGQFNHAPVLEPIGDKFVGVDEKWTFKITATDFDQDNLTYSAYNLPTGATLDPQTGDFQWTPAENQIGQYPEIIFTVTDDSKGNLTDSETITITVIINGLMGHWPMDDDIAGGLPDNKKVIDASGNGNHGTARRATHVLHTPGVINGALTFNGSSDYINCGNGGSLDVTGSITLIAWINPASLNGTIISKRTYNNGPVVQYLLDTDDHDNLRFLWYNRGWKGVSHDASTLTDQWSHVAGTYNAGSNVVKLYVNGAQVASGKETSGLVSNNASVMIGAWHNSVTACNVFEGAIDQVMIFDRALSQKEIKSLLP